MASQIQNREKQIGGGFRRTTDGASLPVPGSAGLAPLPGNHDGRPCLP